MSEQSIQQQIRLALGQGPVPPADGEVAELVAWLRSLENASVWFEEGTTEAMLLSRAATLLQQLPAARTALAEPVGEPSNFDPRLIALATSSEQIPTGPYSEDELREQWDNQADKFNQWGSLDLSEQLAWAQARAIAADRNRHPAALAEPEPPADGEVSEGPNSKEQALSVLDDVSDQLDAAHENVLRRALERLAPQPVLEGPSDDELLEWAADSDDIPPEFLDSDSGRWERAFSSEEFCATVRAVLARWGH